MKKFLIWSAYFLTVIFIVLSVTLSLFIMKQTSERPIKCESALCFWLTYFIGYANTVRIEQGAIPESMSELRIVSPNGGETFHINEEVQISWFGKNIKLQKQTGLQLELWEIKGDTPNLDKDNRCINCFMNGSSAQTTDILDEPIIIRSLVQNEGVGSTTWRIGKLLQNNGEMIPPGTYVLAAKMNSWGSENQCTEPHYYRKCSEYLYVDWSDHAFSIVK